MAKTSAKKQGKSGEKLKSEDKYKDYKENAFSIQEKKWNAKERQTMSSQNNNEMKIHEWQRKAAHRYEYVNIFIFK